jgi:pimeloyl-ACP methyl ester carboxylesterase
MSTKKEKTMNKSSIVLIPVLFTVLSSSVLYGQQSHKGLTKSDSLVSSHLLTANDIERLLVKPACLNPIPEGDRWSRIESFPVPSKGITVSAELYLPEGEGPWPAVIIVPGGFNETELIMRMPRFEAPRFAQCGFAAVVYYKRGTGPSGGRYADATNDDFIDDVGSIARKLAQHPRIDRTRIGASGGSSGGFVASIAAARFPEISFAINKSGPIVLGDEGGNYNIDHSLRSRGYADSLVDQVMPLWKRHHAAWSKGDSTALRTVADEIREKRKRYDFFLLPTPYDEVFTDSNLVFLWPQFRSASRDYVSELKTMRKKWLSIYGEKDPIVPVASCVRTIEMLMKASRNDDYGVIVLPDVDHSFINHDTRRQVPVIRIMLNWLHENARKK